MRALLLAAFVAAARGGPAAAPPAAPAAPDEVERRREEIARELVRLGTELQREIVARDADAIAARVPPDGLRCAGRTVPRAKVARDLRTPGSWLHDVFFGGPSRAARPGFPGSLSELLATAKEVAIVVSFRLDRGGGATGRPCIDYRVEGMITPGAPLCFERREGRWWFTESLYPCG